MSVCFCWILMAISVSSNGVHFCIRKISLMGVGGGWKEGVAAPLAEITVVILVFLVLGVGQHRAFLYLLPITTTSSPHFLRDFILVFQSGFTTSTGTLILISLSSNFAKQHTKISYLLSCSPTCLQALKLVEYGLPAHPSLTSALLPTF